MQDLKNVKKRKLLDISQSCSLESWNNDDEKSQKKKKLQPFPVRTLFFKTRIEHANRIILCKFTIYLFFVGFLSLFWVLHSCTDWLPTDSFLPPFRAFKVWFISKALSSMGKGQCGVKGRDSREKNYFWGQLRRNVTVDNIPINTVY